MAQLAWHQYDFILFGGILIVAFFSALTCLIRAAFSSHFGNPYTVSLASVFVALATYTALRCAYNIHLYLDVFYGGLLASCTHWGRNSVRRDLITSQRGASEDYEAAIASARLMIHKSRQSRGVTGETLVKCIFGYCHPTMQRPCRLK